MALVMTMGVKAQIRTVSAPDTAINADTSTINFNSIASKVKSFQATVSKISGTVAGKVYLQGTVDGNAWLNIDSLVLTNVITNTKVFPAYPTIYNSYRAYFITSGTQQSVLTLAALRRPDE